MYKTPIVVAIILCLLAAAGILLVILNPVEGLDNPQKVTSIIAISACLVAAISATFVVSSYLQSNKAYIAGQKPSLLIQVVSQVVPPLNSTVIHYKNTTNNEFEELSLVIQITTRDGVKDLSDLFVPKMFMAGQDVRHRKFDTFSELSKRGVFVSPFLKKESEVVLTTGYSYLFNGKEEKRKGPSYQWNFEISQWELL